MPQRQAEEDLQQNRIIKSNIQIKGERIIPLNREDLRETEAICAKTLLRIIRNKHNSNSTFL